MEVQFGPNSIDEPNLLYKLQCKIKVFNTDDALPNRGYNLVASSCKYGLVFVGVPSGSLSVYYLHQLINKESEPAHMTISLLEKPTHVSVSCDYELVAVTGGQMLCIYKVIDFQNANTAPSLSIKYDMNPVSYVTAIQWNPCIPDSIALAFYDGTLVACHTGNGEMKKVATKARCICWSPKGKQLVTGNNDGTLHQFKPDLTPAKAIPAPNLFEGAPVEALAVHWISTYQFAVVYKNAADNSRPSVTIVNTPKGGTPSCLNYEDICYSMGSNRPWYYFLQGVAPWNIILAASSNSMEMATIGSSDGGNWMQWSQPDEARPELPLTDKKQENYPVGVCIDTSAIHQLPWGENETLTHMPLLHIVSQTGLLTIFNVINLNKQAMQLCSPPQQLTLPAEAFTSQIPGEAPKSAEPTIPTSVMAQQTPAPAVVAQPINQFTAMPTVQPASLFSAASTGQPASQYTIMPTSQPASQYATIPTSQPASQYATIPTSQPASQYTIMPTSQPASQYATIPTSQPASQYTIMPTSQPASIFNAPAPTSAPIKIPSFTPTQTPEQVPAEKTQPSILSEPPKPQMPAQPQPTPENAALKAEQEKINKAKANQELKNMLVKEVNDFQNDLYNFMLKTRETQARIQRDVESINSNFNFNSIDTEQLKKECSIDELRNAIVQLKLELVRACAVIAEARTHSNAREFHQWTQADPLTTKRVSSVKKLAYYVQTQLDQAQKALDYKWSEAAKDHEHNMTPGKRMIRPILDDVYQPLVKQQEILSRQQAVLRTLRKTLNECDVGPVFKSSSLLRSTPFRNKDPLSKLTKNILNMSIEPQNPKLTKGLLTVQKLEALKDALVNHKTVRIKPVNVELRQHFVTMKENYEKIVREKMAQAQAMAANNVKTETQPHQPPKYKHAAPLHQHVKAEPKIEIKQEAIKHSISAPTFTTDNMKPAPLANVARTLFTDEPKQELPMSVPQQPIKPFSFMQASSQNTKSALKDLLQTKSQANPAILTEDKNLFLGQKICSPTGISQPVKKIVSAKKRLLNNTDITANVLGSSAPTPVTPPSTLFTSKPISEMSNMFSKLPTPTFEPPTFTLNAPKPAEVNKAPKPTAEAKTAPTAETKTAPTAETKTAPKPLLDSKTDPSIEPKPKIHSETGEIEDTEPPKVDLKPKPMTNLFGMKPPIPDVVRTTTAQEKVINIKPIDKLSEKSKENVPKIDEEKTQTEKKEVKPLGAQSTNKSSVFGPGISDNSISNEPKPNELKAETKSLTDDKADNKITTSEAKTAKQSPPKETTPPIPEPEKPAESKSPASSLFGAAVASQPKSDGLFSTPSSSIFTTTNPPTVFGAKSVFGSNSLTKFGQTSNAQTAASVFASASEPTIGSTNTDDVPEPSETKTDKETAPTSVTSSTTSGFGSTITAAFGSDTSVTSAPSVFAATPTSVFGQASGAFAPTTTLLFPTTTASAFGQSVFGTTTQASAFESTPTATASSVFGTAASQAFGSTTPTKPTGSIFGSPTAQAPVFGASAPTQPVFGSQTTQSSLFGTPTSTTQVSVFGTPTQTTLASGFGTLTQTTQASVFSTPTQTTQVSVFGTPTQTTQASVFGTPTQTTQASVFGTPTQTTQASIFGTPTQTTQASVFGTPTQTTQASVFGTPTQTTQASVFGTPPQTTQASVFGTPTQATQASVFGAPAANSGSLFGGGEANLFASASISTTSAPTGTGGGNIFGGSSSGSVFGGGSNVFGGKAGFGSNNTAASIFGGAASFGQQKPATNLWAGGNSTTAFGSTGFGQPTTQASSIFGGSTGGSFSAPSSGAFGSVQPTPAFGSGESQPSSVFGSPQQQGASAFGGSPVFGAKPAFGQPSGFGTPASGGGFGGFGGGFNKSPSGFGAPAAFGGGATFGGNAFGNTSPGKVFGGAAAPSFGSPTQQSNATFENLAGQNTLTFGSLAQTPQQSQQPSFNTSPSFTGWRG